MTTIDVIGGGIAGLYFAAYAKQLDSNLEVRVFEKGSEIGGYGYTIYDTTLALMRELRGTRSILELCVDVDYDEPDTMWGVPRKSLIDVLEETCREKGVTFINEEVTDLSSNTDYTIIANGINSKFPDKDKFGRTETEIDLYFTWGKIPRIVDEFTNKSTEIEGVPIYIAEYPISDEEQAYVICTSNPDKFDFNMIGDSYATQEKSWKKPKVNHVERIRDGNTYIIGEAAIAPYFGKGEGVDSAMMLGKAAAENIVANTPIDLEPIRRIYRDSLRLLESHMDFLV